MSNCWKWHQMDSGSGTIHILRHHTFWPFWTPSTHKTMSGSYFFYIGKSRNAKYINLQMWKYFAILVHIWKTFFFHLDGTISIKAALQACNIRTGLSILNKSIKQFWLTLPHLNGKRIFRANGKIFSHLCLLWLLS